jgi:hypothetical protein
MAGGALAQEAPSPNREFPRYELGLQVGYGQGFNESEDFTAGGPGVRVQLLARLGRYLALGPETAFYLHAGSQVHIGPEEQASFTYRPLFTAGVVARAGVEWGRVRPSLLAGLGWYKGAISNLGYALGAEVEVRLVDWLRLVLDARYHDNVHNFSFEGDPHHNYKTLGLGARLTW